MQYFLIFLVLIIFQGQGLAQEKTTKSNVSMVTGNQLEEEFRVVKAKAPKESKVKPLVPIYRKDAQNLLLGNFCAETEMENFGVNYIIMPPNQTNLSKSKIFFRNLKGHFRVFLRKGFFWQKRLKKRIQDCGYKTGDLPKG